jgi:hypothetical protein
MDTGAKARFRLSVERRGVQRRTREGAKRPSRPSDCNAGLAGPFVVHDGEGIQRLGVLRKLHVARVHVNTGSLIFDREPIALRRDLYK